MFEFRAVVALGVLIGSPTRYGNRTAQMKQLIDSTASLWLKGKMEGKTAGVFTCTASTHGGQETTVEVISGFQLERRTCRIRRRNECVPYWNRASMMEKSSSRRGDPRS